jgi:cyclic pyranopterin phosphate synthase
MHNRVIPLVDARHPVLQRVAGSSLATAMPVRDTLARPLHDLRISVTDRCNFRCSYCMPKEVFDQNHPYLPHSALLSFEEITRLTQQFMALGVRKVRLTGGEPLLRRHLENLVEKLAELRTAEGEPLELTLTTNGSLLARKAAALKAAGLQRVTVSLDALDDTIFRRMNDVDFPVRDVLDGIAAAQSVGLGPIKVNMVVKRGTNDDQIVPMARHFRGSGIALRFIEYMDVGSTNGWRMDEVLPSAKVLRRLQEVFPLVPLEATRPGETAQRWGYADAMGRHDPTLGEIGFISSVTQAFCHDCNRARLSTEGKVFLCLFAHQGHDLRALLRSGADDATLRASLTALWQGRSDRYSELRTQASAVSVKPADTRRVEMSYIGG